MTHPATLPELQAHYGERYRWLLLLAVMVGTMASIMSSTIINVAVPDMSRHYTLAAGALRLSTHLLRAGAGSSMAAARHPAKD